MTKPPSNVVRLPRANALSGEDCRLLVESVVDYAIFMLDTEGYVATWNLGAERIKGYRGDEIIGQHFSTFYGPEDIAAEKPKKELEVAAQVGRVEDEGWRLRKDGTKFWANVVITALRDPTGELRGFGKVTRDLTARRAVEEQLRRADERFHHLVDAVVDYAIFLLDPTGRVATWNVGANRLKGYTTQEIIGKHLSVFYPAEERAAGRPERILDAVRDEGRFEDEGWRVRKDGTRFWANVVITALRDDDGNLLGFAKVTRDLSSRRRAEEELRRSEERFRLLVENVAEYAIYMLDLQGNVATWNLGAERMKGYSSAEIIGTSFARFFTEEDIAAGKPARELSMAQALGRFEDEGWRVRKDGSRFWANAVLTALQDAQGKPLGFAKITRDLTRRRQAEEAERQLLREQTARDVAEKSEAQLRESEERFRALSQRLEIVLEGVADGITVEEPSGNVVFANTAAARSWGLPSGADLVDKSMAEVASRFDLLDAEGHPVAMESLPARQVLAGGGARSAVLHVRERAAQRDWWVLLRAGPIIGSSGQPELAISIWHDITVQRREEVQAQYLSEVTAALGRSLIRDEMVSGLAHLLVPRMADWCAVHLLEGDRAREVVVVDTPELLEAVQEYRREYPLRPEYAGGVWGVISSGVSAVLHPQEQQPCEATSPTAAEARTLPQGRRVGAALIVPLRSQDRVLGAIELVYVRAGGRYDASDVVLLEALGRRAGAALENAQLYEVAQRSAREAEEASRAKDEFLAIVSHELRTPLSAILGWATLLKSRVTDAALIKPLEVIHRNAEAQVRIIDDILDVSRVITGKLRLEPKPVDLVTIARDALEVIRPSAEAKKIRLEFAPHSEFCLLVADAERLQQVIWNLLSNSVKFSDANGRIRLSMAQQGAQILLVVEDDGRGIEPAFLPLVFDRFKQADSTVTRRVGGLGLGLALVRHIVELHGGRVSAASAGAGKGATFTITLPIHTMLPRPQPAPVAAEPQARLAPMTGLPPLTGIKVLVIDDEPDARELIAAVLVHAGATVETAESSAAGFDAFGHFHPDVLVSDIGMPGEDGYSLIRRIRALPAAAGGRIPALALTAFAREEDRTKSLSAGFTTHIGKPVDPEALANAVANLSAIRHRS